MVAGLFAYDLQPAHKKGDNRTPVSLLNPVSWRNGALVPGMKDASITVYSLYLFEIISH